MPNPILYTNVNPTAKGDRIWLEGSNVAKAGFLRGYLYNVAYHRMAGKISLTLHKEGTKKVSGRTRNGKDVPIIDLINKSIGEVFPTGTRLRVTFQKGMITIIESKEEVAQKEREKKFVTKVRSGEPLKEATLFAGGGISTEAIHQAIHDAGGTSNVTWIAECELKYVESANQNCMAITDATAILVGTVEEIEDEDYGQCDILSFSMPCAGFSKAGRVKHRQSAEQHSGTALFGVTRAIRSANPAIIISENVREAQDSPIYILLKSELTRLGYTWYEQILDASHTGTFENRPRYWLVALSNGLAATYEGGILPHRDATSQPKTLNNLLDNVIPENMWCENQYLKDKQKRDAAAGKGFANRQLLLGDETRIGTIGRYYAKKRSTEPFIVRDVDDKERLLTPNEHAKVKSIPTHLIQGVPTTTAHEIMGQSVDYLQPYLLVKQIMENLIARFNSNTNAGMQQLPI